MLTHGVHPYEVDAFVDESNTLALAKVRQQEVTYSGEIVDDSADVRIRQMLVGISSHPHVSDLLKSILNDFLVCKDSI